MKKTSNKMTNNKKELEKLIREYCYDNTTNKKAYTFIREETQNRIDYEKLEDVFDGRDKVWVKIKKEELYWLARAIFSFTKVEEYNPYRYFTQEEVAKANNFYLELKKEKRDTLVISNCLQVAEDEWLAVVDYGLVADVLDEGFGRYNFETQREPTLSQMSDGTIYLKPTINQMTVKDMVTNMDKEFFKNNLTWNILPTGEEEILYDEEKQEFIFSKGMGSRIDICDGYHRTLAISIICGKNPLKRKEKIFVHITNFTVERANKLIVQEQKGTKIDKKRVKVLEESLHKKMIKQINVQGNETTNFLFNKISDYVFEVFKYKSKLLLSSDVIEILEEVYPSLMPKQLNKTREFLIEFINEVYYFYSEEFDNIEKSRKESLVTIPNAFIIYFKIASLLQDKQDWQKKLSEILLEIDFEIESEMAKELKLKATRRNKSFRNKIYSYVNQIVERVEKQD